MLNNPQRSKKTAPERELYAYTNQSHLTLTRLGERGLWLKVGQTKQESAELRVGQQDGTSDAEPLLIQNTWKVPMWLKDTTVHAELKKMGIIPTRTDKHREWFECSVDDVSRAINNIRYGISRPNSFTMRPEQKVCVLQAVKHFESGGDKFLINAIMRFGKTFVTYQILKAMNLRRVLVLTYKPAVEQAWREDLETHVDFEGFTYYHAKEFDKNNPVTLPDSGPGCDVLFASFQDINDMSKPKWRNIRNYNFDMVVLDEQHYGTGTVRAQDTLNKLSFDRLLEVSGTPLKALMTGEYFPHETFSWSYADEQAERRREEKAGWETEIYRSLPVMNIHTFEVDAAVKGEVLSHYDADEGFSMSKMFASDDGVTFNDEPSVKLFLDQVLGRQGHKNKSPFRTHAADHSLWMLPSNVNSVNALCLLLKRMGDYEIINAAGANVRSLDKVLDTIERNEKTITVTCGRFNTGVTVKKWDMVVMLDDGAAAESYFQTIFRAKSPDSDRAKEMCYVVDYNPQRCLSMIYNYAEIVAKKNQGIADAVREFLDFAPVMDHTGNKPVEVSADEVLDFISDNGDYVRSFGSPGMVNWAVVNDYSDNFHSMKPMDIINIVRQIADSGLDKGKNFLSKAKAKKNGTVDLTKKERDVLRLKVMGMLSKLPRYMFLSTDPILSVDDITGRDDPLFEKVMGVSNEKFGAMCGPFIREDRLNRCIVSFNQRARI